MNIYKCKKVDIDGCKKVKVMMVMFVYYEYLYKWKGGGYGGGINILWILIDVKRWRVWWLYLYIMNVNGYRKVKIMVVAFIYYKY